MCGIVGFISDQEKPELIEKLTSELSHRGPDEQNYEIIRVKNNYIHFGSARLSIRDLNDGQMPMKTSDGSQLIYNGEIFNFSELKTLHNATDLKSDTRLILEILSNSKSIPGDMSKIISIPLESAIERKCLNSSIHSFE